MHEEIIGFGGYQDDNDEELKGKGGAGWGKFGLNQGAFLTKFAFNPNGGKDGAAQDTLDISITIGEKEFMMRIFPTTKVYEKGNELTDKTSPAYIKAFNADWGQKRGIVTHILKAFVAEENLKAAMSNPNINSFKTWAEANVALLSVGYNTTPIDVFLQYQWAIKGDNDKTYLELPKNMKGGYWFCQAQTGVFVEDRTGGELKYLNETGAEHPFTRNTGFMESPKAIQQSDEVDSSAIAGSGRQPEASKGW